MRKLSQSNIPVPPPQPGIPAPPPMMGEIPKKLLNNKQKARLDKLRYFFCLVQHTLFVRKN